MLSWSLTTNMTSINHHISKEEFVAFMKKVRVKPETINNIEMGLTWRIINLKLGNGLTLTIYEEAEKV